MSLAIIFAIALLLLFCKYNEKKGIYLYIELKNRETTESLVPPFANTEDFS